MLNAFDASGRLGLAKVIYDEARFGKAQHPGSSWDILIDDGTPDVNGKVQGYVFLLLTLLANFIIRSLIKNNIAFDVANNRQLREYVTKEMVAPAKPKRAGIYANVLRSVRGPGQFITNIKPADHGKWLTSNEVATLLEKVRVYIDNKNDPISQAENLKIDRVFTPQWKPSYPTERRFMPGAGVSMARAAEW